MIKHIDDLDSLRLKTHGGVYEAFESAWVRKVLKPWSVFVDVGAHIGYYSALAADVMDGAGRVAAHEIMVGTPAIRNLIREAKVAQMYSAIQTGQQFGMQTLDQNLQDLVKKKIISPAEARSKAANKDNFPV